MQRFRRSIGGSKLVVVRAAGSVLLVTLDSCRYDTFAAGTAPNLKSIGPLHRALAPAGFTYASHAAMFVGFTPWVPGTRAPFVNPKAGRIFKLVGAGHPGYGSEFVRLTGRNIVDGFRRLGHATVGTGAVSWFDPQTEAGTLLTADFDEFLYVRAPALDAQLAFLERELERAGDRSVFAFLNVGETHVPYAYAGAPWDATVNPCKPFSPTNDADECRRRQRACLEFVDARLAGLLRAFDNASVVVCADHGDAWGEDGVLEHGVPHPKVLEVPFLFRLASAPSA